MKYTRNLTFSKLRKFPPYLKETPNLIVLKFGELLGDP